MVKAGLLPSPNSSLEQTVTLSNNDSGRYEDRWIFLKEQKSKCVFTKGIDLIHLPVAHGEGKFFADSRALKALQENHQIVFKYCNSEGILAKGVFPLSPNASLQDIAGICDKTGRIFGMMPHPERCLSVFNRPDWEFLKEKSLRSGKKLETKGEGNKIFKNAVEFVKENF
jgi:phosphoribosylformylglycinamidine synthase